MDVGTVSQYYRRGKDNGCRWDRDGRNMGKEGPTGRGDGFNNVLILRLGGHFTMPISFVCLSAEVLLTTRHNIKKFKRWCTGFMPRW